MNNKAVPQTSYSDYINQRDPDNIDIEEVKEPTEFSEVEYVQIDEKKQAILCETNVGENYEQFSEKELPLIKYSPEKYKKIIKEMKKIKKIEEMKDKKKNIDYISVSYYADDKTKVFPTKCKETLEKIFKQQTLNSEIVERFERNKRNGKNFLIGFSIFSAAAAVLAICSLSRNSKYEGQATKTPTPSKNPNENEEPELLPLSYEDKILTNVNKLYEEIKTKHNIIVDKDDLSNTVRGLVSDDHNFIRYVDGKAVALNDEEEKDMISNVLNFISMNNDNNMNLELQPVYLSDYIENEQSKEIISELEKRARALEQENTNSTGNGNFEALKREFLKESFKIISGNVYKMFNSTEKVLASTIVDEALAKYYNGKEYYTTNDNAEVKTFPYKELAIYFDKMRKQAVWAFENNVYILDNNSAAYNYETNELLVFDNSQTCEEAAKIKVKE